MELRNRILLLVTVSCLCLLVTVSCLCLLTACGDGEGGVRIGCSNNIAGMWTNYAITQYCSDEEFSAAATDSITAQMMMDCCSSKSTWSMTAGELDGAVMCPDSAQALVSQDERFLIAGPLTWNTEALAYTERGGAGGPDFESDGGSIGYMNGQERQREELEKSFGSGVHYTAVLASSLPYALSIGEISGAVLDLSTALVLDYPYQLLSSERPTAVLVVSKDFYGSEDYHAFLFAMEQAKTALAEYGSFCEAMKFLYSEEIGRKEYEEWLSQEIRYQSDLTNTLRPAEDDG